MQQINVVVRLWQVSLSLLWGHYFSWTVRVNMTKAALLWS